jgi:hypothetical protein
MNYRTAEDAEDTEEKREGTIKKRKRAQTHITLCEMNTVSEQIFGPICLCLSSASSVVNACYSLTAPVMPAT